MDSDASLLDGILARLFSGEGATAQTPMGNVSGMVSLPSPDGQQVVVPGVTLTLTCAGMEPRVEVSSEIGQFRFTEVPVDDCSILAELLQLTALG